jgi:hypothetical protein
VFVVWYTHAVEYSDGELATEELRVGLPERDGTKPVEIDAETETEREADTDEDDAKDRERDALCVTLPVDDGIKPAVLDADKEAEREANTLIDAGSDLLAVRDAETDADAETLKPRVGDVDGDRVGDTSKHCTYSRKLVWKAHPPPPDVVSVLGTMEHEFRPRHVAFTDAPLLAAPAHVPSANGPDGHAPVGLP